MPASTADLTARYMRISEQLRKLFTRYADPQARMATAAALLHHKMPHFFWTGFYRLQDGDLIVGPYQGPLACAVLDRGRGVCWACLDRGAPIVVPNVHEFPGHIPCDERSLSEVVVPVRNRQRAQVGVLDVDADKLDAFTQVDAQGLLQIAELIYIG